MTNARRVAERLRKHLEAGKTPERALALAVGGRIARPAGESQARRCKRLLAAVAHDRGSSYAAIARGYGISPTTATEWVKAGRPAWEQDPARCRRELVERFGETFVARMVPASEQDGGAR